ncbi:MAG: hypothetical protein P8R42_03085 [Candidatus Binatia bacterium]|nr:hypothetical protein [Candidatus Binatia bacterium]
MRRYVGWSGAVGLAVLSAALLASCGGGTNSTNSEPATRTPQFVLDPVGTTSNTGSLTMGVSKAGLDANRADRIVVFAQLLDPQRRPLVGVPVGFTTDFPDSSFIPDRTPPDGVTQDGFPASSALTDGDGIAQITVVAPSEPGRMAIVAATARNLRLSGLIFVNVYDVGFIPGDDGILAVIPVEIKVTDPSTGSRLQFVVIGGIPFTAQNQPPASAAVEPDVGFVFADLESPAMETPPFIIQNFNSGIGVADLVFNGRFPASVLYTLGGRVAGAHTFGLIDAAGQAATGTVTVEFTGLVITPETASIEVGQSQAFSLTGGVPPYNCIPSGGVLTPTTIPERGGTTVFTPDAILREGTFTILCTDQSGQTISAAVSITPLPAASPGSTAGPVVTPTPAREAERVEVSATPPTLNGPDGGTSTITARVLDQNFDPLAGVPVIFTLPGQSGDPTPTVPSIGTTTGVSDGNGQVSTILTVPTGTAPQFLTISAETDNGKVGSAQVGITSQTTTPSGDPARISAAILRNDACQLNQDGSYTAIISALVSDDNGNPVTTGVAVKWGPVTPAAFADVISESFTNAEVPCSVDQYRAGCSDLGLLLSISPQPGTATTCFTYDADRGGQAASVVATVAGTSITTSTNFTMPAPVVEPTPSPAPPVTTPTPAPPSVVPNFAALDVGKTQVFAVSGGVAPYTVSASGGTATPTTVPSSGSTFSYLATTPGNFTILVSDSNGQVTSAAVNNTAGSIIQVDKTGPLGVAFSAVETVTITGGGAPPYAITLTGGLGGSITGSPLPAPGSFDYNAPASPTSGQILITDSAASPNTLSISVFVP